jgi:hypothetical protein
MLHTSGSPFIAPDPFALLPFALLPLHCSIAIVSDPFALLGLRNLTTSATKISLQAPEVSRLRLHCAHCPSRQVGNLPHVAARLRARLVNVPARKADAVPYGPTNSFATLREARAKKCLVATAHLERSKQPTKGNEHGNPVFFDCKSSRSFFPFSCLRNSAKTREFASCDRKQEE